MVTLSSRENLGVASVILRKGCGAHQLGVSLGIEPPRGPRRVVSGSLALAGVGPGAFLATHEGGTAALLAALQPIIGVSVSDQSDAYWIRRLSGAGARGVLSKVVPLDPHPSVFTVGAVAVTTAGHMAATLWRLEDGTDEAP